MRHVLQVIDAHKPLCLRRATAGVEHGCGGSWQVEGGGVSRRPSKHEPLRLRSDGLRRAATGVARRCWGGARMWKVTRGAGLRWRKEGGVGLLL